MEKLGQYLRVQGLSDSSAIRVSPLSGGQSNPTYLVTTGTQRCVLRKKPPGQLLASAHAIDCEYRVMSALQESGVPVLQPLAEIGWKNGQRYEASRR